LSRPKVFVYRPVDETGDSHQRLGEAGCDVVVGGGSAGKREILAAARDAVVLLGATFRDGVMDRAFLESLPQLRLIAKYTIGVDDVDVDAATELGVLVTHSPTEANWGGVAEGTLALMLAFLKRVRERDRHVKAGGWRDPRLQGTYVGARKDGYSGIRVGIVGLGRVGRRVADLLRPWHARVVASDPYVEDEIFARHGVTRVGLEELLEDCDVVSLHCNLTHETRGIIGRQALARMKSTALLINTARGALIDIDALCDTLESGELAGAALDVLPAEPPAPSTRILRMADKVILSPHMVAANQGGTLTAAIPWATEAVLAAVQGRVPLHVYNAAAVARWQSRFGGRTLL
jgi:D-3-phosphoglycerate dehydrogenase